MSVMGGGGFTSGCVRTGTRPTYESSSVPVWTRDRRGRERRRSRPPSCRQRRRPSRDGWLLQPSPSPRRPRDELDRAECKHRERKATRQIATMMKQRATAEQVNTVHAQTNGYEFQQTCPRPLIFRSSMAESKASRSSRSAIPPLSVARSYSGRSSSRRALRAFLHKTSFLSASYGGGESESSESDNFTPSKRR